MKTCDRCRFFDLQPGMKHEVCSVFDNNGQAIHKGYCRRRAPACEVLNAVHWPTPSLARWPVVLVNDWCGEFATRTQGNGNCQCGSASTRAKPPWMLKNAPEDEIACHGGRRA